MTNQKESSPITDVTSQADPDITSNSSKFDSYQSFLANIPVKVFVIALLAALISISPYWLAQLQTPAGWSFTWNVSVSPDYMQYRVWTRQTQNSGVLVANKFTSEPNKPHLLVPFYYLIGKIANLVVLQPELVYAYTGSLLAFLFTILLYATVRLFLKPSAHVWWVFLLILLGGGLGAHLRLLSNINLVQDNLILHRTLLEGLWSWPTFENYRSHYVFITLFDTHFLLIWLLTTTSIASFYFTLKKFSLIGLLVTSFLFALTTLSHIYEGVTLIVITTTIVLLFFLKRIGNRFTLITYISCCLSIIACFLGIFLLYHNSGLMPSNWRAINILFSTLLISYPIAWLLIFLGIIDYWRKASLNETFLIGWVLGCCIVTLSGPFYPYPDRGTMTLQIPLYIIAGSIYFLRYKRVTWKAALFTIILLGVTPIWILQSRWENSAFVPNRPEQFLSMEHQEIIQVLKNKADENDILITDMSVPDWESDPLWLAPEYPGKFYAGHFFLTDDFDRKRNELIHFFQSTSQEQVAFLQEHDIRFIFLDAKKDLQHFVQIPGISELKSTSIGSILEYQFRDESGTQ